MKPLSYLRATATRLGLTYLGDRRFGRYEWNTDTFVEVPEAVILKWAKALPPPESEVRLIPRQHAPESENQTHENPYRHLQAQPAGLQARRTTDHSA